MIENDNINNNLFNFNNSECHNEKVFWKIWRFKILRNQILHSIKNQFIEFPDHLTHLGNRIEYNQITSFEWIIEKKQYSFLKDKLRSNQYIHSINKKNLKKFIKLCQDEESYRLLFIKKRDEIEIIDLIEESVKHNSEFALKTFRTLYGIQDEPFSTRLLDLAIGRGNIEVLEYMMTNKNDGCSEQYLLKNCLISKNRDIMIEYINNNLNLNLEYLISKYPNSSSFPFFHDVASLKSYDLRVYFLFRQYHTDIKRRYDYAIIDKFLHSKGYGSLNHLKYRVLIEEINPKDVYKGPLLQRLKEIESIEEILNEFKHTLKYFYIDHFFYNNYSKYKEYIDGISGILLKNFIFEHYKLTFKYFSLQGLKDIYSIFLMAPDEFNNKIFDRIDDLESNNSIILPTEQIVQFFNQLLIIEKSNFYIPFFHLLDILVQYYPFETIESLLKLNDSFFEKTLKEYINRNQYTSFNFITQREEFDSKFVDLFFKFNESPLESVEPHHIQCYKSDEQAIKLINYLSTIIQDAQVFINIFSGLFYEKLTLDRSILIYSQLNLDSINLLFSNLKDYISDDFLSYNYFGGIESYLFNSHLLEIIFNNNKSNKNNNSESLNRIVSIVNNKRDINIPTTLINNNLNKENQIIHHLINNSLLNNFSYTLYFNIIEKAVEINQKPTLIIDLITLFYKATNNNIFLISKVYDFILKKGCYQVFQHLYSNGLLYSINDGDFYTNTNESTNTCQITIQQNQYQHQQQKIPSPQNDEKLTNGHRFFIDFHLKEKQIKKNHEQFFIQSQKPIEILLKGYVDQFLGLEISSSYSLVEVFILIIDQQCSFEMFLKFYKHFSEKQNKGMKLTLDILMIFKNAINYNRLDIIDFIIKKHGFIGKKEILNTIRNGNSAIVQYLFKNHIEIFKLPFNENNRFHPNNLAREALYNGHLSIYKLCVWYFPENNFKVIIDETLLNSIITKGYFNILKYFFDVSIITNFNILKDLNYSKIDLTYNGNYNNRYTDKFLNLLLEIKNS
ncbi:hypothetical protein DICPUDRAFT_97575 [Dictyostelium purpureum]|uniref:Uncharacterized protein n=1 Tax=Dictyostelium purpureum TaxID=5786 RepID=F0ZHW2_DICPU|nr:uncharacterized protein DICPUDRAFT_97575 [Dictyostelium purpureum]EGC36493.1 hypothetical protein DICPUDRAFT_97575 [Dictyostelium purpureum]|eukprot:XP_003287006.1 hypothetical protein DICPUDRAFT_97575 [Dictyostelium purpureum]